MGYYIDCENPRGKVDYLWTHYGAEPVESAIFGWGDDASLEAAFDVLDSEGKVIICVVDNALFEAAGVMYSARELGVFFNDDSGRPKTWLIMDKDLAYKLSGYKS